MDCVLTLALLDNSLKQLEWISSKNLEMYREVKEYHISDINGLSSLVPRLLEPGKGEEEESLVSTASRSGCVTTHEDKI